MNLRDLTAAASGLGCDVAALQAVAEVESAGAGLLADGRPKILFEAHIFGQRTRHRFTASHPALSTRTWDRRLYQGGVREWERLEAAIRLDRRAALESASWGAFQIMGFNFAACGFADVEEMVAAMQSESGQLQAFARFIGSQPSLRRALQAHDWTAFARAYNGPGQVPVYAARIGDAWSRLRGSAVPADPLPAVDRTAPARGLAASKSVMVGAGGVLAGAGALADQAQTVAFALRSTTDAVASAGSIGEAAARLLASAALPWLLVCICVGAGAFVVWRYVLKARRNEVIVR